MTVIELSQCLFWAVFSAIPMIICFIGGSEEHMGPELMIATVIQIAFGLACFKAGIHS